MLSLWIALLSFSSAHAETWNLSDVSYLYPLPKTAAERLNFQPGDAGERGELLPLARYDQVKPVIRSLDYPTEFSRLRAVGVRIDPCGEDSHREAGVCRPEIRIVWQPLLFKTDGTVGEDGAIHSFYRLNQEEWKSLTRELSSIRTENERSGVSTTGVPLGVHPAFLNPSRKEPFAAGLRRVWLKYCGETNLFQVTLLRQETGAMWHRFEGVKKQGNEWLPLKIPRVDSEFQDFFNDVYEFPERGTDVTRLLKVQNLPQYPGADSLESYVTGWHTPAEEDRPNFTAGVKVTYRIENPKIFTTANLDCVHCHLAAPARFYFTSNLSGVNRAGITNMDRFPVPAPWTTQARNVTVAGRSTKNMRAFGYYFEAPTVNDRVIHESIRVAESLSH